MLRPGKSGSDSPLSHPSNCSSHHSQSLQSPPGKNLLRSSHMRLRHMHGHSSPSLPCSPKGSLKHALSLPRIKPHQSLFPLCFTSARKPPICVTVRRTHAQGCKQWPHATTTTARPLSLTRCFRQLTTNKPSTSVGVAPTHAALSPLPWTHRSTKPRQSAPSVSSPAWPLRPCVNPRSTSALPERSLRVRETSLWKWRMST